jgi:hypothetical protein
MTTITTPEPLRELDHRRNDGIDVRLLWDPADDRVVVTVSDAKTGESFAMLVEPHDALDAFHHPYAHAPDQRPVFTPDRSSGRR